MLDNILIDLCIEEIKTVDGFDHLICLGIVAVGGAGFADVVGLINAELAVFSPVVAAGHRNFALGGTVHPWICCSLQLQPSRNLTA
ncbi:hypothetical protein [Gulosibacter bifidus]|uniref:Uncharacterized protein n=1 Tax=Gulosibacter bifidus TaxID=272239 RepID=A0ABW5RGG0_9MICO|nr:hypothetical protein [Gulosibacter bifidus]